MSAFPQQPAGPATQRYVALVRGASVGAANRVATADLRADVSSPGYHEPCTAGPSGLRSSAGPGLLAGPGGRD